MLQLRQNSIILNVFTTNNNEYNNRLINFIIGLFLRIILLNTQQKYITKQFQRIIIHLTASLNQLLLSLQKLHPFILLQPSTFQAPRQQKMPNNVVQ